MSHLNLNSLSTHGARTPLSDRGEAEFPRKQTDDAPVMDRGQKGPKFAPTVSGTGLHLDKKSFDRGGPKGDRVAARPLPMLLYSEDRQRPRYMRDAAGDYRKDEPAQPTFSPGKSAHFARLPNRSISTQSERFCACGGDLAPETDICNACGE